MALYLISYDLIKTKDYAKLHDAIRKFGTYCRPLESTWIIETAKTSENICDYCMKYVDYDDKLLVVKLVDGMSAWYNLPIKVSNWLEVR